MDELENRRVAKPPGFESLSLGQKHFGRTHLYHRCALPLLRHVKARPVRICEAIDPPTKVGWDYVGAAPIRLG